MDTAPTPTPEPEPQPPIIKTRYEGGRYVASINGVDMATDGITEYKAAQKAVGNRYHVKEVNPHVFRAVQK